MPTTDPIFEPHGDELGPSRGRPPVPPPDGRRGLVVVDNTAKGRALVGIRLAPDVSTEEYAHLARAMTLKDAPGCRTVQADPESPPTGVGPVAWPVMLSRTSELLPLDHGDHRAGSPPPRSAGQPGK